MKALEYGTTGLLVIQQIIYNLLFRSFSKFVRPTETVWEKKIQNQIKKINNPFSHRMMCFKHCKPLR